MARHHPPFVVEEIAFFAAIVPVIWLAGLTIGSKFLDRLHRLRKTAYRTFVPATSPD